MFVTYGSHMGPARGLGFRSFEACCVRVWKRLMYFVVAERMRTMQHSDGPRSPNYAVRVVSLLANPSSPLPVATGSCG